MYHDITEEIIHVKGTPTKMVIFLHGYLDDAKTLDKTITPMLDALDDVVIIIPSSPIACEITTKKMQWYSMHDFDPQDSRRKTLDFEEIVYIYEKAEKGLRNTFEFLNPYIMHKLKEYKLKLKNLYICGFSQGASVALYTALMLDKKVAGVISFSGILCPTSFLAENHSSAPNTLLIHGKEDNLIKFEALEFSKKNLERMNCVVSTYAIENENHRITEDGLNIASSFINANSQK